jgi:hypothetical protein
MGPENNSGDGFKLPSFFELTLCYQKVKGITMEIRWICIGACGAGNLACSRVSRGFRVQAQAG